MSKPYDASKGSDMKRMMNDLEKSVISKARSQAQKIGYDQPCPFCGRTFKMHSGENQCPYCLKTVDVELDINF